MTLLTRTDVTPAPPLSQQANSPLTSECHAGDTEKDRARERKRKQRERERAEALTYVTADWQLFLDRDQLPQKAGCQPGLLLPLVLRELVDNALDAGAEVSLIRMTDNEWVVTDNGPGIDPADIPRLFSINRPLVSTKLPRYPVRGMLGNGLRVVMGAVTVSNGSLIVETRGHRLTLAVDPATGLTHVTRRCPAES